MLLYNIHTHTKFSHDSAASPEEICERALRDGLFGFAITDHLDCEYHDDPVTEANADASFAVASSLKEKYRGRLLIAAGVELGDALFCPELAVKMTNRHPWDIILLSVHAVRLENADMPFSTIDFSDKTDGFIDEYLYTYFNDLFESVNTFDYDVLSHLTVPLRYIRVKYGRQVDLSRYGAQIESILKTVVRQDKTLEVNTSGYPFIMPDAAIIEKYRALGGKHIALGSDAHVPTNISHGLFETAKILNGMNPAKAVFFSKRKRGEYYFGKSPEENQ